MGRAWSIPRPVIVAGVVAAVLLFGGLALLGLPGAIYALAATPVVEALRGLPRGFLLSGDRAWPVAILMTAAVPPALPVLVWLGLRWFKGRLWPALLATLAGLWLWSVLVLLATPVG